MPAITDFPEELISNISIKLGADDVAAFRLTCRDLERKSFHEFATEYFSAKTFMISTESLKVLVGIAKNDKLREYLRSISIMTVLFTEKAFQCPNGCKCAWQPTVRESEAYHTYVKDQKHLRESGKDTAMLRAAFDELPNVKLLCINDVLDPDVDFRGGRKVFRTTAQLMNIAPDAGRDSEYKDWLRHVWSITTEALAESSMSTITELKTDFARPSNGIIIADDLDFDMSTLTGLQNSFVGLKTLSLQFEGRLPNRSAEENTPDAARGGEIMKTFSTIFPGLEKLDLHFAQTSGSGVIFGSLIHNLNVNNLTSLHVVGVTGKAKSIAMGIVRLVAVKDLCLSWVHLSEGDWTIVLKAIHKLTAHLAHLHLVYLMEAGHQCYFLKQPEAPNEEDDVIVFGGDGDWDDDEGHGEESELEDLSHPDSDAEDSDEIPELEEGPPTGSDVEETVDATTTSPGAQSPSASAATAAPTQLPLPSFDTIDTTLPPTAPDAPAAPIPLNPFDFIMPITDSGPPGEPEYPADRHHGPDYTDPTAPRTGERGYYICVRGDDIAAKLPIFINEYNLGEDNANASFGGVPMPLPGPNQASFNTFMNALGAAIGMPLPTYITGGAGPAQGGNTAAAGALANAAAAAATVPAANAGHTGGALQ